MSLTAERIVELFEEDARARRRLAELLVSEPDVRLAIINAVIRDVATKHDLAELRRELRGEIERVREELRGEIARVEERLRGEIDRLYRLVAAALVGIMVSIATTVLVRVLLP